MRKPLYVLDSFALLAYFQGEPAGLKVKELLKQGRKRETVIFLSVINLGEILYTVERKLGRDVADDTLKDVLALPVRLVEATMDRVVSAARIKASIPISYADAFAAAIGLEMTAPLVTGDPEFKRLESTITVLWLQEGIGPRRFCAT